MTEEMPSHAGAQEPSTLGSLIGGDDRPPAPPPPPNGEVGRDSVDPSMPPAPPSPSEISEFTVNDAAELIDEDAADGGGLLMKYLKGDD